MQPVSRQQVNRNKFVRITSFEGKNDSFRIPTGDPAASYRRQQQEQQQQQENQPMASSAAAAAPVVDGAGSAGAGEISPESSFMTVILNPVVVTKATKSSEQRETQKKEHGEEDHSSSTSSSSGSSPPTHPAFYLSRATAAAETSKENFCRSSMAAPFSSPSAALLAHKALLQLKAGGPAGAVMLERFLSDGNGDEGHAEERRVLGNVDTNCIVAPSNDTNSGKGQMVSPDFLSLRRRCASPGNRTNSRSVQDADTTSTGTASEKGKRDESKKPNHVNGAKTTDEKDQTNPPEPTSYAEAVKEDPLVAEKRQAAEGTPELSTKSQGAAQTGGKEASKPTPAGDLTFAQAVKEVPAASKESIESKGSTNENTTGEKSGHSREVSSQASTAVDYPEIRSKEDDEEEEQRRRDKEKAAVLAGARWAPLAVPLKRRLQTMAVLMHCIGMGLTLSIFFALCAVPIFWPVSTSDRGLSFFVLFKILTLGPVMVYLFSILFSTAATNGKLQRRNERVRRLPIWRYFADYFPAKLHKTHELIPTRKYILGYHPHGIISHGAWAAFATDALGFSEKFPGITNCLVTLESNFHLPIYREYVLAMGLQSVSKQAITNILTRGGRNNEGMGRAATIVIGGARESLEAQPKTLRLVIKERKGFIKLALQTGADLVPVLAFGENDLYDQLDPHEHPWLHGLQRYFLKAWKFTVPLLHGRGIFNYDVGLMPYRRPLNIVVGKPIPVVQASNPDNTEINRLHDLYVEELQKIWDRYKDEFAGHRKEEMQFMD